MHIRPAGRLYMQKVMGRSVGRLQERINFPALLFLHKSSLKWRRRSATQTQALHFINKMQSLSLSRFAQVKFEMGKEASRPFRTILRILEDLIPLLFDHHLRCNLVIQYRTKL